MKSKISKNANFWDTLILSLVVTYIKKQTEVTGNRIALRIFHPNNMPRERTTAHIECQFNSCRCPCEKRPLWPIALDGGCECHTYAVSFPHCQSKNIVVRWWILCEEASFRKHLSLLCYSIPNKPFFACFLFLLKPRRCSVLEDMPNERYGQ